MFRRKKDATRDSRSPRNPWIVVAIGNPGLQYERSRHNVGWWVADLIVDRYRAKITDHGPSRIAHIRVQPENQSVVVAYPKTYVNRSGAAVRALMREYDTEIHRLIVVSDDINLPPGRLRIRRQGGAGGHNGLQSIIDAVESNEFPRVRIGVGKQTRGEDQADHVLSSPTRRELEAIEPAIVQATEAVEVIVREGVEEGMNRFNR